MKEMHIFIYGDSCFISGIFYGFLLYLESKFCLPVFAFFRVVKKKIPCSTFVTIYAVNYLLCSRMFRNEP